MRQSAAPGGGAVVMLSGKLDGSYQGDAGKGEIAGRFGSCGYSQDRAVLLREASGAVADPGAGERRDDSARGRRGGGNAR